MFSASVCAMVMFMLPFFSFRLLNNLHCAMKLQKWGSETPNRIYLTWTAVAVAIPLLPLVALACFGSGTTVICGVIALVAGGFFWLFNH